MATRYDPIEEGTFVVLSFSPKEASMGEVTKYDRKRESYQVHLITSKDSNIVFYMSSVTLVPLVDLSSRREASNLAQDAQQRLDWLQAGGRFDTSDVKTIVHMLRRCIQKDPICVAAYAVLGRLRSFTGERRLALRAFQRAVANAYAHFPPDAQFAVQARYDLANCHRELGNLVMETVHLRKVVQVDPNHLPARYMLGVSLADQEKVDEAIVTFEKVVQGGTQTMSTSSLPEKQVKALKENAETELMRLILQKLRGVGHQGSGCQEKVLAYTEKATRLCRGLSNQARILYQESACLSIDSPTRQGIERLQSKVVSCTTCDNSTDSSTVSQQTFSPSETRTKSISY